jgi:hypothetical protein
MPTTALRNHRLMEGQSYKDQSQAAFCCMRCETADSSAVPLIADILLFFLDEASSQLSKCLTRLIPSISKDQGRLMLSDIDPAILTKP